MTNLGISTIARTVEHKKKQISDVHEKYVDSALIRCSENAIVLNIDDYYNIHVLHQPNTTATSQPTHIVSILLNPCSTPAILRNMVINSKVVDYELIIKHLEERFITNLGISYHNRNHMLNYIKNHTDDELIDILTMHSYNDRLANKKSEYHIKNAILVNFVEGDLKRMDHYIKALKVIYGHESISMYIFNHAIPIITDWSGQIQIRKAIAQQILAGNMTILSFVTAFLPIMGPLHVFLN
ncbi:6195_t:CDS:1, partial [Gigaspora margarita]